MALIYKGLFIHIEHFLGGVMPHWYNVLKLDERIHRHAPLETLAACQETGHQQAFPSKVFPIWCCPLHQFFQ